MRSIEIDIKELRRLLCDSPWAGKSLGSKDATECGESAWRRWESCRHITTGRGVFRYDFEMPSELQRYFSGIWEGEGVSDELLCRLVAATFGQRPKEETEHDGREIEIPSFVYTF